ncbi:MAG: hypothetical protein FRX49_10733 [Trebouxia sp. A1-2]|nr:MAG: hypothetical protein FRX49_10733 [Trebouxia sp. A1-2]
MSSLIVGAEWLMPSIHGSFCSPVKDVACQDAFYKRSQPDFWGGLVQLIQQLAFHKQEVWDRRPGAQYIEDKKKYLTSATCH